MENLILYFNELCLDQIARFPNPGNFANTLPELSKCQPDYLIGMKPQQLSEIYLGKPLREHLKNSRNLTRTQYQLILKKITSITSPVSAQIRCNQKDTYGLSLAQQHSTWGISLCENNSIWDKAEIIDDQNYRIAHIANQNHIKHWQQKLYDWGEQIASSHTLDMLGSHPIVMFSAPLEHNPPHVHLLAARGSSVPIAKFRIEDFVREKGKPTWDKAMQEWLKKYQKQLLKSWQRCQLGELPYKLKK